MLTCMLLSSAHTQSGDIYVIMHAPAFSTRLKQTKDLQREAKTALNARVTLRASRTGRRGRRSRQLRLSDRSFQWQWPARPRSPGGGWETPQWPPGPSCGPTRCLFPQPPPTSCRSLPSPAHNQPLCCCDSQSTQKKAHE